MRAPRLVVAVCLLTSALAACSTPPDRPLPTGTGTAATGPTVPEPAQGAVAWGVDNCIYKYTGSQWVPGDWCVKTVEGTNVLDWYVPGDPNHLIWRSDDRDATYMLWWDYASSLQLAIDRQTQVVYTQVNGQWLAPEQYATYLVQQEQAASYEQAQVQIAELQAQIQEGVRIWTAPDCTASYEGCG